MRDIEPLLNAPICEEDIAVLIARGHLYPNVDKWMTSRWPRLELDPLKWFSGLEAVYLLDAAANSSTRAMHNAKVDA
jgi:hypothetical protein